MAPRMPVVSLVLLSLVPGCGPGVPLSTPESSVSAQGTIRLLQPVQAYSLHTLRSPNDEAALNAGEIHVFLQDSSTAAPGRLLSVLPGTSRELRIQHLRRDQTYRVLLQAYKPDPETPGGLLPMSDDANSTTTFHTLPVEGSYATTQEVTFKLRLNDQVFSGIASGTVHLTRGDILDTPQSETLVP